MIHFLRHTAVCLWLALLLAGGVGLWLLPAVQSAAGLGAVPFAAAGSLAAGFMAIGWATTRFGLGQVKRRLRAAEEAEREGRPEAAEAELRDALCVLDRFWLSSVVRRRSATAVSARLARLYLARGGADAAAFVDAYLLQVPQDEEAAESWAAQAERRGGLVESQQALAGRLCRRHPQNAVIARAAARLFLSIERSDYEAQQCYRRVWDDGGDLPGDLRAALARALGQPAAGAARPVPPDHAAGTPADARPAPPPVPHDEQLSRRSDEDVSEAPFRMALLPSSDEEDEPPSEPVQPTRAGAGRALGRLGRQAAAGTLGVLRRAWAAILCSVPSLRAAWRMVVTRQVLGAAVVAGLGAVVVWMVAVVMEDVFNREPDRPATTVAAPEPQAPAADLTMDPYTLQVAAYLRQENALKLVDDLKRKGLDAYWTETSSAGKVYYQVRISHFPDQQAARDYGRTLRGKGVINDFYVTNYVR